MLIVIEGQRLREIFFTQEEDSTCQNILVLINPRDEFDKSTCFENVTRLLPRTTIVFLSQVGTKTVNIAKKHVGKQNVHCRWNSYELH